MVPRGINLVSIFGLGRSGGVQLGRLLGNHPDVVNVGELLRLDQALDDPAARCACGLLLGECEEWNRLMAGIPARVKRNFKKWTPDYLGKVRENAHARVLVNVSKTRGYRLARRWKQPGVGFVLLLRDPRELFRSHVAERHDLESRLALHKKWIVRFTGFASQSGGRCHVMYYEDLVTAPEPTLKALCDFIGIDFRPEMIFQNAGPVHMATFSASPQMNGTGDLRLDERWQAEMNPAEIARITNYLKTVPLYNDRYHLA